MGMKLWNLNDRFKKHEKMQNNEREQQMRYMGLIFLLWCNIFIQELFVYRRPAKSNAYFIFF